MKKKIALILVLVSLIISGILGYWYYGRDPLSGQWRSDQGDGFGLVQAKGAPFFIEFSKNSFHFRGKDYRILSRENSDDGRIFIKTDNLTLKLKFKTPDEILFSFPGIGIRRYKRV